jgi:hypothetical protein
VWHRARIDARHRSVAREIMRVNASNRVAEQAAIA